MNDQKNRRTDPRYIPDLVLEQYLLAELPEPEKSRIEQLCKKSDFLQRRLAELQTSNEDFLKRYPVERMVPIIQKKTAAPRFVRSHTMQRVVWGLPAAALVVVGVILFPVLLQTPKALDQTTRVKGSTSSGTALPLSSPIPSGPGIVVFRLVDNGFEALADKALVKPYERVQIAYRPAGHRYGMLFSIDGRGRMTLHVPEQFGVEPRLDASPQVLLPFAYQLDDAPTFERFYLVLADTTFDTASFFHQVQEQLDAAMAHDPHATPRIGFPQGFTVTTFDLRKP